MKTEKNIKIISGKFARIYTGNATYGYIIDGDDVQDRANRNLDTYWGETSKIYERGIEAHGLIFEGEDMVMYDSLYKTVEAAEKALEKMIENRKQQ